MSLSEINRRKIRDARPNPEAMRLWIEALRSGDYAQTTGMLNRTDDTRPGFCCLGVMCDVSNPNGWVDHLDRRAFGDRDYFPKDAVFLSFLGTDNAGAFAPLADANDDDGVTFDEIADFLESCLS